MKVCVCVCVCEGGGANGSSPVPCTLKSGICVAHHSNNRSYIIHLHSAVQSREEAFPSINQFI